MKTAGWIFAAALAIAAGAVVAAEPAKPALPDPEYCSRRDADPEKCVIQDGPPQKPIVRNKQQPKPPLPPEIPGDKPGSKR
ncbi:hypothetical protein D3C83_08740 [compost metagenome]